jgi:hypothetical protein
MKVLIEPFAEASLLEITLYIEMRNTRGAGKRWLSRFQRHIKRFAIENMQYPLCNNLRLAQMLYSCIHYNHWTIAFRLEGKRFVIYEVIPSSMLM